MIIRKKRRLQNLTDYKKRVALVKGDMPLSFMWFIKDIFVGKLPPFVSL